MKRKREVEIICIHLQKTGIVVSDAIKQSVANGLKQIRSEKFQEKPLGHMTRKKKNPQPDGNLIG